MAKMTLIGLYNFDGTIFDNIVVPDDLDKQELVNNILLRGGEFEVLYADPNFNKLAFGTWSYKYQRTFNEWLKGIKSEYNPIENYDRYEDIRDNGHNSVTANDTTTASGNGTTEDMRSAYDSSTYEPVTKTESNSGSSSTSTSGSNASNSNVHDAHIHGNIGVTTAPAMLKEFYDISKWNIIEQITDLFLQEFVLPIY